MIYGKWFSVFVQAVGELEQTSSPVIPRSRCDMYMHVCPKRQDAFRKRVSFSPKGENSERGKTTVEKVRKEEKRRDGKERSPEGLRG